MTASPNTNTPLMFAQALAAGLEALINKVLSLPSATLALAQLREKTLTLKLAELGFSLSFTVTSNPKDKIILVTGLTQSTDCTINTSIKTLLDIKAAQSITALIKQDKLDVIGDIKVAQAFATLIQGLAIDWPSELANYIGDVPTQKLTQLGHKLKSTLTHNKQQITADVCEYILHEQPLVVNKNQLEKFNQAVITVQQQTQNLEARIARLTQQKQP